MDYIVTLNDGETTTVGAVTSPETYTIGVPSTSDPYSVDVGTQGPIGYTGSAGTNGYTGSAGTNGTNGYTGSQGNIGYTGSAGTNGYTGSAGTNGTNGYTGSQGNIGYTGSAGTNGTNGYTGSQGNIGYTGSQGLIGYTGSAGTNGTIGYTGSAGTNGTNGYTGSQGNIGYTGSIPATIVINKTNEQFTPYASVNGVFTFDCSNGYVFNATSLAAGFTPSFSNFVLANNTTTSITLVLSQGITPYAPTSNVQLGTVTNTAVSWQGGSVPTGNANKKDVLVYSVLNSSGTYTVLGQLVSFG